jgi:hypothetical protein
MLGHHFDAELPQKVEERLLVAGHLHPEPPGIHCTDTETPGIDRVPPLFDTE